MRKEEMLENEATEEYNRLEDLLKSGVAVESILDVGNEDLKARQAVARNIVKACQFRAVEWSGTEKNKVTSYGIPMGYGRPTHIITGAKIQYGDSKTPNYQLKIKSIPEKFDDNSYTLGEEIPNPVRDKILQDDKTLTLSMLDFTGDEEGLSSIQAIISGLQLLEADLKTTLSNNKVEGKL